VIYRRLKTVNEVFPNYKKNARNYIRISHLSHFADMT
jgi:hypothetical protein